MTLSQTIITKTPDITLPHQFTLIPVDQMINEIKAGSEATKINNLRSNIDLWEKQKHSKSEIKKWARDLKSKLPAYTVTGTFINSVTNINFQKFSGIIGMDWDNLADPVSFKALLTNHPSCVFTCISPSGDGIKAGFLINEVICNDAEYKLVLPKLWTSLEQLYPHTASNIDKNCKDVRRFMYASFDCDIFVNFEAVPIDLSYIQNYYPQRNTQVTVRGLSHPAKIAAALMFIDKWDYETWITIACAIKSELGDSGFNLFHQWSKIDSNNYEGESVCLKKWDSLNRDEGNRITVKTLFKKALDAGWDSSIDIQSALDSIDNSGEFSVVVEQVAQLVRSGFPLRQIDDLANRIKARGKLGNVKTSLIKAVKIALVNAPKTTSDGDVLPIGLDYDYTKQCFIPSTTGLLAAVRDSSRFEVFVGFDNFTQQLMLHKGDGVWIRFSDIDYTRLREKLMLAKFAEIDSRRFKDSVNMVARENSFDSAIIWINGLIWDGKSRISSFCVNYLGTEVSDYTTAVSFYMWTALAGRVLQPGVKADMVPILIGNQGVKKSTAIACIAPSAEFFCEIDFSENDADKARRMQGKLVCELSELRGMRYDSEMEGIKSFISRQIDEWIPKYCEISTRAPRRSLLIGTTNDTEILHDATGSRRFLPIKVGETKVDELVKDHLQLWAEARELFDAKGILWEQAELLARDEHAQFEGTDPWESSIASWIANGKEIPLKSSTVYERSSNPILDNLAYQKAVNALLEKVAFGREGFSTEAVINNALFIFISKTTVPITRRVNIILRKLGFEQKQVTIDGVRHRRWFPL
jgi:hypothetical protein